MVRGVGVSGKDLGWVADVGGTNIRLALVGHRGEILREDQCATPPVPTPMAVLDVLESLCANTSIDRRAIQGLVLGIPGVVDSGNGMVKLNANLGWRNVPLEKMGRERFGLPVVLQNDVRLHTLGEWKYGVGRQLDGAKTFTDVVIGTGIAAGLVVGGQLLQDPATGEIGHLSMDRSGWPCGCGKRGCVETVVGAKGLRRLCMEAGHPVESFMEDVVVPLIEREPWAVKVWQTFAAGLAFGLSALIMVLRPSVVVLSGGIAGSFMHWQAMLWEALAGELFPGALAETEIVASALSTRAPYLGGSYLLFGL